VARAPPSFNDAGASRTAARGLVKSLAATTSAERYNRVAILRLEATRRRTDTRGWVVQRRERTRHLIELGGLVQKAGLVDLTDDDRATIYGALLDVVAKARNDGSDDILLLWKRRGKRAFEMEGD
jgi:hypothetical protein